MGRIADAFRNAWRDFASDGVPSSGSWNPRKPDIRPIGAVIEEEMASAVSVPIAAERQERQAADTALGGRIDDVENVAYTNASVFESVAAGLAATTDGQQFQVSEGDEIVRYRNNSGTAVEVARYPSATVASAMAQNIRTSSFLSRPGFAAGEITGPYASNTGNLSPTPTWSLDADGALVVNGDQTATIGRFWDAGHRWDGAEPVEIIVEGEVPNTTNANGLYVALGTPGGDIVHFLYSYAGALGVWNSSGNQIAEKGGAATYSNVAYAIGEKVRMRVVINTDGSGFVEGINAAGTSQRHAIYSITERGMVAPAVRRAGATKRSRLSVRRFDPRLEEVSGISDEINDLENRVSTLEDGPLLPSVLKPLPVLLAETALNGILAYGQSNSVGADAAPIISVAQPYNNVTFAGGPRAWDKIAAAWSYMPLKPLVEDEDATGGSMNAGTVLAETPCSGAANYASSLLAIDGVSPANHM